MPTSDLRWRIVGGASPEVFALVGPHAMSRPVVRELGGAVLTDERYHWVVALDHGEAAAWASLLVRGPALAWLDCCWVVPAWRGRGLYRPLVERRLELAGSRALRVSSRNPIVHRVLAGYGFLPLSQRGAWTTFERKGEA